jgi:plasmid maintenance system antidote protein VapI
MNIYRSKNAVAKAMGIDRRSVDKLIQDKKVVKVSYDKITRYLVVADLFAYLAG